MTLNLPQGGRYELPVGVEIPYWQDASRDLPPAGTDVSESINIGGLSPEGVGNFMSTRVLVNATV